jgi:hypothetical protein
MLPQPPLNGSSRRSLIAVANRGPPIRTSKGKGHPEGWPRYNPFYRVSELSGISGKLRLSVPKLSPLGLPLGSDAVSRYVIVDI